MKFTRAGKEPACMSGFYYDAMRVSRPSFGRLVCFATRRHESADAARDADESDCQVSQYRARKSPCTEWGRALSLSLSWRMLRSKIKVSPREPYVRRLARCPKIRFSCAESTKHDPLLLIIELNDLIIYRSLLGSSTLREKLIETLGRSVYSPSFVYLRFYNKLRIDFSLIKFSCSI